MNRFLTLSIIAGSLLAISGCGDTPLTVRVTGSITDPFGQPIEGADVRITAGLGNGRTQTDELGIYTFKIEGFGTFALDISAEGYASARTTFGVVDVPDTDGTFEASAVRDVTLYPTDGTLSGRVLRAVGSVAPAVSFPVRIQYTSGGIRDITLPTETLTDDAGRYQFTGLPSGVNVRLNFPSWDEDEDGIPETGARAVNVFMNANGATLYNTTLNQFESPNAVWNNVSNTVRQPDDVLEVFYNVAMDEDPARRDVRLRQTSPVGFDALTTHSFEEDGNLLRVTPAEPMTEGASYNLFVSVQSVSGQTVARSYNFTVASASTTLAAPMNVRLADPDATITNSQINYTLRFSIPAEADGYRVYNRVAGDVSTTDWVEATEATRVGGFTYDQFFQVPFALRRNGSPFAEGGVLEVAVTSRAGRVESALSNILSIQDQDCPQISFATGSVTGFDSWRNAGGSEDNEVALRVRFTERMDVTSTPTLTIPTVGVDGGDFDWVWTDPFEGRFEGLVPAGTEVADAVTVEAIGMADVTGNNMCDPGVDSLTVSVF